MYPVCGQVKDVEEILWDVRDVRTTKHGFDLHFGSPAENHGAYRGGLPRLIATRALRNFWETNRLEGHGFLFDLPAGRTTLKRVRRRLQFNFNSDLDEWWTERLDELRTLSPREFACKHDLNVATVFDRRTKMVGVVARPIGWWRKPKIIKLLLSDLTLREVGENLGIGTSYVFRLRKQLARDKPALTSAIWHFVQARGGHCNQLSL